MHPSNSRGSHVAMWVLVLSVAGTKEKVILATGFDVCGCEA